MDNGNIYDTITGVNPYDNGKQCTLYRNNDYFKQVHFKNIVAIKKEDDNYE